MTLKLFPLEVDFAIFYKRNNLNIIICGTRIFNPCPIFLGGWDLQQSSRTPVGNRLLCGYTIQWY